MAITARPKLSSGNMTADRRVDYAMMLAESGDRAAAAELMEQALELAPDWPAGWFQLGEFREGAGMTSAIAAYRRTLALSPEDGFGAGLKLALLGDIDQPSLPPSRYVERLFDDYADRFDAALVGRLGYSLPGKLMRLIGAHRPAPHGRVADLGCGTGLFGLEIAGQCAGLEGYDLSENMLAKARARTVYTHLGKADLSLPPNASGLFMDRPHHRADLVAATDVMMYLGDLAAVFTNVAALLAPSGIFAFSAEKAVPDVGFHLLASLRYAHSTDYIRQALAARGLQPFALEETEVRTDAGKPIIGLLVLARAA